MTFRVIQRASATLSHGMFNHTATWNWRSGCHDKEQSAADGKVRVVNSDGSLGAHATVIRDVDSCGTPDWQTRMQLLKSTALTVGIRNVLDQAPPLSLRTAGGGKQMGFDARYANPLGRTFYVNASCKY